ncbi:MAG: hypothetical protein DIU71_01330 [Proteobacteria bacterium]|nr:MAG: hypothetical protein DIU71_01330 [Pseudomonadota bacterium]
MTAACMIAVLVSGGLLALLGWQDPKRLRNRPQRAVLEDGTPVFGQGTRRLLGWLVLLPGIALAIAGQWWGVLVWLGATCTLGWIIAQVLDGHSRSWS